MASAPDKRSNRCPKCKRTYTSATHQKRCLNKTPRKRSSRTSSFGARRTMSEILASTSQWGIDIPYNPPPAVEMTQEPSHA